jgi:signal transduction histidine kinase/ActR/RegA family two-component response regulator
MTLDYDAEVRRSSRALSEIAHALESADDMNGRVIQALVLTKDLVPYRRCALLKLVPGTEPELFVVPELHSHVERSQLLSTLQRLFRLVAEIGENERASGDAAHLALPVMGLDQVIGVLRVEPAEETVYDARHVRLLSVVAAQLGAYLAMIKLRDEDARRTKELAKANEFQQLLLGIVGHDLRDPLSVIVAVGSQLLKRTVDQREAKNIERVLRSAQKANRIITDLLDVTHVRVTGQMPVTKQRVDVCRLLQEIVDDARVQHPEVELVSRAGGSAQVDCDPVRLSQLTTNLINNALTHGEQGAPIRVELHVGPSDIDLSIHNRGSAISPDLLSVIFDPFKQGSQNQRRRGAFGGLGLGLYIVDQIARAHGGRVVVRSTETTGTTFAVTFPRWHEAEETSTSTAQVVTMAKESRRSDDVRGGTTADGQAADGASHPMVMVVDDDVDVRAFMAELLQHHGFTVATASNGAEALELLRAGMRPKLVLLDLCMPVMDGETFCSILHEDSSLSSIPVCVISSDAGRAVKVIRSGASEFLRKPVQVQDVLKTLERVAHRELALGGRLAD